VGGTADANRRYGGFDALRILAALGVVLTHSFGLTGHTDSQPTAYIGRYVLNGGSLGVSLFFITSGFLVALSFDRALDGGVFAQNRVARIWPALIVLVLLSVLVLGPLMTTLSTGAYFTSGDTLKYLGQNVTLLFGVVYRLPGVFTTHNQVPAINGSLWTLPYEIWAYIAVLGLGVMGLLRRQWLIVAAVLGALLLFRFGSYTRGINMPYAAFGISMRMASELGSYFPLGVLLSGIGGRFDLRRLAIPAAIGIVAASVLQEPTIFLVAFACLVIGLGSRSSAATTKLHRFGDPSYGIYIWSFPIQQVLVHAGVATTPWPMLALSAPLSVAAGYLSWHLIERPALRRFKRNETKIPPPAPTREPAASAEPLD
jgi:peptidoglycan/LPS O-acetylase OafA/YrhL